MVSQSGLDTELPLLKVKDGHPRLFLNLQLMVEIKRNALFRDQDIFKEIKENVDKLEGSDLELENPLIRDGHKSPSHKFGTRAAEAAILFLILEDRKYLEISKDLLRITIKYYQIRNDNNLNIHWYNFSRINALAAFDWIFNYLSKSEKDELGRPLLEAIAFMADHPNRRDIFRRNGGGVQSGFYGPNALPWYAGVVFYRTGINDLLAEKLLTSGFEDHIKMLKHRSKRAGDDGGSNSGVIGYALGAYPWAAFNFFHTFFSATGIDISKRWDYLPNFVNYVFWNWLPDKLEFGYGDAKHLDNALPVGLLSLHLEQLLHFYKDDFPQMEKVARYLIKQLSDVRQEDFPYMRFLLNPGVDKKASLGFLQEVPIARHFENMGQVFFRSGNRVDDTYALFTAGGSAQHKHFDDNNFVIFRNGFLALDSGTRPQPGIHLSHYYCRTVAHNCITVKMPGEQMPKYWGGPSKKEEDLPIPNDGGQNELIGGHIFAFDENEQYAYVASNATNSYHEAKVEEVIRQFVFVPPDHFVIFDRVRSTKREYSKRWLLHTASEPEMNSLQFKASHQKGVLFCRTLFPKRAKIAKVGGEGKQFWSDGKNWLLPELTPDDWNYKGMNWLDNEHDLFGQWRVEVVPEKAAKEDYFLHLIQVGDGAMEQMTVSKAIACGNSLGVGFQYGEKEFEVTFFKEGDTGGEITIFRKGRKILEENFTTDLKSQKGFLD